MSTPVRVRVVVRGVVQGVFFRDSCQREARANGVGGWVRNRADGSVEAEFEGGPDAVERMIAWCHDGPGRARVESVTRSDLEPLGERGFSVR